ncbi:unnamed protein product [Caenorhabditis bovis]|uniref:BZIP domain-containing protein n=1 Tax=Caenorhabditis bovis TaxID=2654633 RepID=A0A8S1EMZ4_9PELO|nr:unnamed protein product [Caenorhabditis bovis]
MIPATAPYGMPPFDASYFNYAAYPLNQMYPQPNYCPDYSKSDSNSDESMSDNKVDHKLSPKYREKRIKNNEAAKKSRLNRKQRENELRECNAKLKADNDELRKMVMELKRELEAERAHRFNEQMVPNCDENKYLPLRDVTNQQPTTHMQPMNPNAQMMNPDHMQFPYKSL